MPWTKKQMLRDANSDLIPQYWDVSEQNFKPLTGSGGANDVRVAGSVVELFNGTAEVSAGAFVDVTPDSYHNGSYKQVFCTVISKKDHEYEARLQLREDNNNMLQFSDDNDVSVSVVSKTRKTILPKPFITKRARVAIINNDTEAHTYQIRLGAIT